MILVSKNRRVRLLIGRFALRNGADYMSKIGGEGLVSPCPEWLTSTPAMRPANLPRFAFITTTDPVLGPTIYRNLNGDRGPAAIPSAKSACTTTNRILVTIVDSEPARRPHDLTSSHWMSVSSANALINKSDQAGRKDADRHIVPALERVDDPDDQPHHAEAQPNRQE
jgi:hypothetical protein